MSGAPGGSTGRGRDAVELAVPQADGTTRRYRALEAWRGAGGHALCYFLALADGAPADDDRADRRAALGPGETPSTLGEAALRDRLQEAAPLTATERRFTDRDGKPWLAQNIGPVWAGGDVAAGLTGVLFTALAGPARRVEAPGGHIGDADAESLRRALERALAEDVAGEESPSAAGSLPSDGDGGGPPS